MVINGINPNLLGDPHTEQKWAEFLTTLKPWELHLLYKIELETHDNYISGEFTLPLIRRHLSSSYAL